MLPTSLISSVDKEPEFISTTGWRAEIFTTLLLFLLTKVEDFVAPPCTATTPLYQLSSKSEA